MDETLRQLGQLLLGAIPTVLILLVVYSSYRLIVNPSLIRVLEERRALTVGAQEKARADIAAAEARTAEYEQRLREARLAIFKAQDARRQQALQQRERVLKEARERTVAKVAEAKAMLEREVVAAKAVLEAESERLAIAIVQTILRPVGAAPTTVGGGQ